MVVASPQSRKELNMWIDTKECVPFADGEYLVQTVYGRVASMNYTHKAGWNTHFDSDGVLHGDSAFPYEYVVRWYKVPKPDAVPKERLEEYWRKENSECAIE